MKTAKTKPILTKHKIKKIETAVDVSQTPAHIARTIGYTSKSLAIANLPYHDIGRERWERKNGNYTFVAVALRGEKNPGGKIPFGVVPRLFFIWLITEIVQKRSREILLGENYNQFLTFLGYLKMGGKDRARVREQLLSLFNCAIGTYYDDEARKIAAGSPPESFIHTYSLWTGDKGEINAEQQELFPAKVVVKESFYNEIMSKPIPLDMRIVEALKNSALKLDIYLWLTFRMYSITRPTPITYEDLMHQFGGDYDEKNPRALSIFRTKFRNSMKEVLKLYHANVDLKSSSGIVLLQSATSVQKL